ncbi:MAG: DNA/RNA nuclease SfsA [Abditibacteriota bacterium]|nr:DNA/RNA nuclease SfsA [Abditibacteriota bacterium]
MKYSDIHCGTFLSRPNRFIARVLLGGETVVCHVKNTGRCRELLVPGARAVLEAAPPDSVRKTRYDLVAVYKGDRLVNIDSQAPNKIYGEWAREQGFSLIRPEYSFGSSRLDFYLEKGGQRILAEVKGVTLEQDGVAMFPDAPTERGVRHVRELQNALSLGYEARIYFVIQMSGVRYFTPSLRHHPEFFEALREAADAGVGVYAAECRVTPDGAAMGGFVPVKYIRMP